jgi:hypothetical protein
MAELTVQDIALAGITPSYASAAAGGDEFLNNGRTFLHVKNGGGSPINVTITSQYSDPPVGTDNDDTVVAVTNAEERIIGPFPRVAFNNSSEKVQVAYSDNTSVTVGVFSL